MRMAGLTLLARAICPRRQGLLTIHTLWCGNFCFGDGAGEGISTRRKTTTILISRDNPANDDPRNRLSSGKVLMQGDIGNNDPFLHFRCMQEINPAPHSDGNTNMYDVQSLD